jgi:succinate dehydrogenase / fumarate reductase flavoprotein subunit
VASRAAKERCDAGYGVGDTGYGVYLDFSDAISRLGKQAVKERYGNLFDMYMRITGDDPYEVPMRIYPASHYTMGGLWVDYNLMSNLPGLHVIGEANFSDHGANRLGASALMQGLADGYFVLPYTIGNYLAQNTSELAKPLDTNHSAFSDSEAAVKQRLNRLMSVKNGTKTSEHFHRRLGRLMWDKVGMSRNASGLREALEEIPKIREEFWNNVSIPGSGTSMNISLEKAGRVADFLEFAEVMAHDALDRDESCGAHFREEHVTEDGEAKRDDENYRYVAAWEFNGVGESPTLHKEPLEFENVKLTQRSYK